MALLRNVRRADGWMDGWTDGRMDGWMDGSLLFKYVNAVSSYVMHRVRYQFNKLPKENYI